MCISNNTDFLTLGLRLALAVFFFSPLALMEVSFHSLSKSHLLVVYLSCND